MSLLSTLSDFFWLIIDPWLFMSISLNHVPETILQILRSPSPWRILSPSYFNETLFGNFWAEVGPSVKESGEQKVIPLLEGRVKNGQVHDHVVSVPVSGRVMEVGAGSGQWVDVFQRLHSSASSGDDKSGQNLRQRHNEASLGESTGITKIFGIEPNPRSADALRQRVASLGMQDLYQVVPVGIEDVAESEADIQPGSIDCIVCILCLCSIPDPEKNVAALYRLLKPGGRWYVYEHVQCKRGGFPMRWYQAFVNIFWSFFLGSCRLCRPTDQTLRKAGAWRAVEITQPPAEQPYHPLPHILGMLTKAD